MIVPFRGRRGQAGPCITALSGLTVRMICINHANANYCDLASQSNTHIPAAPGVPAWDTWRKPNMHFGRRTVLQIGRAHVRTPVTNAHLVCRLLLDKKNKQKE